MPALALVRGQQSLPDTPGFRVADSLVLEAGSLPGLEKDLRIFVRENWIVLVKEQIVLKRNLDTRWTGGGEAFHPSLLHGRRLEHMQNEFDLRDPSLEDGLRSALIALIQRQGAVHPPGLDESNIGSVLFQEDVVWEEQGLRRNVTGLTPVYWQLRRTAEGEPVPDAQTGLPVYYKQEGSFVPLH
ncbi:MAG: hypothetical protein R2751_13350 [Bacteroidales bacterium]